MITLSHSTNRHSFNHVPVLNYCYYIFWSSPTYHCPTPTLFHVQFHFIFLFCLFVAISNITINRAIAEQFTEHSRLY